MDGDELSALIGVYDADGTLRGEIAYWISARFGRAHCSLCDLTHGAFRPRAAWKAACAGLPVPFHTYHRDDQPAAVRTAAGGRVPVVVGETASGLHLLLDPAALQACAGDLDRFTAALYTAVAGAGLRWPAA